MTKAQQFLVETTTPSYWTVTFDNPPLNMIDPDSITQLYALIANAEADPDLTVIVFKSADADFFISHYDLAVDLAVTRDMPNAPSGLHPWIDVLVRLSKLPVLTIASVSGRARGAGSEFVLACDIRFASIEKAVFGQFEVGAGAVPGGGPMARLSRLVGRGRALEIVIGADDLDGALAERYGYVNRAVPDAELDGFVDAFARRVAGFEKATIAEAKAFIDQATLPPESELAPGMEAFFKSVERPATGARAMSLFSQGLQSRSDVELRLGHHVAQYKPSAEAVG